MQVIDPAIRSSSGGFSEEDESKRCEHEERRERECFASEPVAIRDEITYIKRSSPRSFIPGRSASLFIPCKQASQGAKELQSWRELFNQ
jgi:hypothetical protein